MKTIRLIQFLLIAFVFSLVTNVYGQNWKREISSHFFYIKVKGSEKCWDLPGRHPNTARNGVQFQIYDLSDKSVLENNGRKDGLSSNRGRTNYRTRRSNRQNDKYERTFTFPTINGTEYFAIKNYAGYIAEVEGKDRLSAKEKIKKKFGKRFRMKKDNGAQIVTASIGRGVTPWQQWKLIVVDRHTVMFENAFTRKAVTVQGGNHFINTNTAKLVSWDRNNDINQRYELIYADGPDKGRPLDFER